MEIVRRHSARAILLSPEREILLLKIENFASQWTGWITPGGGIDPGESEEAGLKRELWEELGAKDLSIGPKVWKRYHEFLWEGKQICQSEHFYLVPAGRFEARPVIDLVDSEMLACKEFRWWKLEDILWSQEIFAPRKLGKLLEELVRVGPPQEPIEAGA